MKTAIKRIFFFVYKIALQYRREKIYEFYKFPRTIKFDNVSFNGNISIGDFTYINEGSRIDSAKDSKVTIGKHCAIGRYVHITAKTHDLRQPTTDESHSSVSEIGKNTVIGDEVWIGDFVFIKDGITIGNNAIVGAHSMVNRDIEPFEIVAGVPIRHIRYNNNHYKFPQ
jgi:maltose O-acetyltransferase